MNIFLRETLANLKSFLIWGAVLVFFLGVGLFKFTGVENGQSSQIQSILDAFPAVAKAFMGIGDVNMATFAGFYLVIEFYVGLIMAFSAVNLGRSAVDRERVNKTSEFLFVRPRKRGFILTMKLVSAAVMIALFVALNFVLSLVAVQGLGLEGDYTALFGRAALWSAVVALVFFAVGAAVASLAQKPENGAKLGNGLVLISYLATVIYDAFADAPGAWGARVFSPLRYATGSELAAGEWSPWYFVVAGVLVISGIGIAYQRYLTRDLAE